MTRLLLALGTRPEIIKMAPLIKALRRKRGLELTIVHTGQHYDFEMSKIFIEELGLPDPDVNLEVGSGSHSEQTARMLRGYERIFKRMSPDSVLAEGDTNSVVAASLSSVKNAIPFGHVESGLRCYDRTMPEEINRTVADHCAEICFAPTSRSGLNLCREGIVPEKIFITGNTIVDACLEQVEIARKKSKILEELSLRASDKIVLVTIHRTENVDDPTRISEIFKAVADLKEYRLVFPIHPRTSRRLKALGLYGKLKRLEHITLTPPVGYSDFLTLMSRSKLVLTDSGGVQEEALTLRVPCLTVRNNTERPETVDVGANEIVGTEAARIVARTRQLMSDKQIRKNLRKISNPLGDGRSGQRIASILLELCAEGLKVEPSTYLQDGSPIYRILRVPTKASGASIRSLKREYPNVLITQAYNAEGSPLFPYPETKLQANWLIQIVGERSALEELMSRWR